MRFYTRVVRGVFALVVAVAMLAGASPAGALTPNDPTWWAAWGQQMIGMPQVWDITTGSPNVVIASIDTGVARGIVDVGDNILPGRDLIRGGPVTGDAVGHGTSVATEMVARGNNGIGIAGYCWYCRLLPVRVTVDGVARGSDIAAGIRYAVDAGARVVNIGFNDDGAGLTDANEASALLYAQQRGVLVFASAGNSGSAGRTYPASYPGAYPVAATDSNDRL